MNHTRRDGCERKPQAMRANDGNRLFLVVADALRDIVRNHVIEHLGTDDGVLIIDETGFLKKGQTSCDVGRQCTGSEGKITNCQIGVFGAYAAGRGHALTGCARKTEHRTMGA